MDAGIWRVILIVAEEVSRENLVSRPSSYDIHDILKEVQELKREIASQLAESKELFSRREGLMWSTQL